MSGRTAVEKASGAVAAAPLELDVGVDPGVRAVYQARARLADAVRRTPLQRSSWLSDLAGCDVHLKLECWQRTGSFKMRGAYNAVAALDRAGRARGLVTASAGNHGQAVALAARLHGAAATVFVPAGAPATKKARIRAFGAELRETDGSYDDAAGEAAAFAREAGARFIHAFSDPAVVAGQGTVGLEIAESLPDVRTVIAPVGGGGLIAGIGIALKTGLGAGIRVLGVQASTTRAMHDAFAHGHVVETAVVPTLCDGLAGEVEDVSFRRARAVADAVHLVEEAAVAPAIRELYRHEGVLAEGAGAVGAAAIMEGGIEVEGPVAVVVSGGNIDLEVVSRIFAGG